MSDQKKILVAGDIMLDAYHFGKIERISPEAPVPVFMETGPMKFVPGGAANVAVNIAAAGIQADIYSAIGEDTDGRTLLELLGSRGISTEYIYRSKERPTTCKLRYIGQNNQQILRADSETVLDICAELLADIFQKIKNAANGYGLIILSDYTKGFLTEEIAQSLIKLGKALGIPVLADAKDKNLHKYRGATLLKPNRKELHDMTGKNVDSIAGVEAAAAALCRETSCTYVLTTMGADGMLLVDQESRVLRVRSAAKEVYDVTGAGDTSIAYLAVALVRGKSLEESLEIANYAAGVQVSKVGTSIVRPEEVERAMKEQGNPDRGKILDFYCPDGLAGLEDEKRKGKKIVFTNGCFDILHVGHAAYLKQAKKLGDILIVGINSDASVKRLKGRQRPVNALADRIQLLSELEAVDYVVPFEEDTPLELIQAIEPDVLVKGGDYNVEDVAGADFVKEIGGRVTIIPLVPGRSTTNIINRIQEENGHGI